MIKYLLNTNGIPEFLRVEKLQQCLLVTTFNIQGQV